MSEPIEQIGRAFSGSSSTPLPRLIVLNGSELLLLEEGLDALRVALKERGFSERLSLHVEAGFDWSELAREQQTLSLFASQKSIELRIRSNLTAALSKQLIETCEGESEDVLVCVCPLIEFKQRKSKWFASLDGHPKVRIFDAQAIPNTQYPSWIKQRFQSRALRVEPGVIERLALMTEGNLLATAQEIEKLKVLAVDGAVTLDLLESSLSDLSQFDAYALADAALAGNYSQVTRVISRLETEGVEPVIACWALVRDVRALTAIKQAMMQGQGFTQACRTHQVWTKRQPLMQAALQRFSMDEALELVQLCATVDQSIKGRASFEMLGTRWFQLGQLALKLAGFNVLSGSKSANQKPGSALNAA